MPYPSADHIAPQAGSFEHQLGNRHQVEIYSLDSGDSDILLLALNGFTPPNVSVDPVEIHYGNEKRLQAGKPAFENATLRVRDYVDAKVREAVHRWFKKVYDARTGKMGYAKDYKKTGALLMTGPDGQSIRKYDLIGLWPSAVNFGDFNMESADPIVLEVTLACDKALYADI